MRIELLCPDDMNINIRNFSNYLSEQKIEKTILYTHYRNKFEKGKVKVIKENYTANEINQILNN